MFGLYAQMLRFRFRWYALATGRLLMRHWQWFLLAIILVPAGIPISKLLRGFASPLTDLFQFDGSFIGAVAHIFWLETFAVAWILVQQPALQGGQFMRYCQTLPVQFGVLLSVDLTMLTLANNILLLPAIVALALTAAVPQNDVFFRCCVFAVLLCLVVNAQYAAMSRRWLRLLALCLGNALLAYSLSWPRGVLPWLALGIDFAGAAALLLVPLSGSDSWRIRSGAAGAQRRAKRGRGTAFPRSSVWLVAPSFSILVKAIAARPGGTALRLIATLGVAAVCNVLLGIFAFDDRTLPAAIMSLGIMGLLIGGTYRRLLAVHAEAGAYVSSLPVRPHYWPLRDAAFVTLLGLMPAVLVLGPLFARRLCPGATLLAIACAYAALLSSLRLPFVFGGRQSALLCLVLTGAWSAVTIAAVTR